MEMRELPRMGAEVGVVGLGTWQFSGARGPADDDRAVATITAAVDAGATLVDTADVYGDGRSERVIGRYLTDHPLADVFVATKMGQRGGNAPASYHLDNFRAWTDRSRANLGMDVLDLVHLHCPPPAVYDDDAVFDALNLLIDEKRITGYGVSVDTCDQALRAIARPGVASVEIVLNPLRPKPIEHVLPAALAAGVGVIARAPLASGLLSGGYDELTAFGDDDHRCVARRDELPGETFAGLDFHGALTAVRKLSAVVPPELTMTQFALRWIIDQPGVTAVIPGASSPQQARCNAAAASLRPLHVEAQMMIAEIYDELIRPQLHHRW
ncbi:aldo/keto reductase [Pilimelia columellifera]|uniref:aldo/keto reductase n=1 Tax=Pilimelia columellifera TaxID=706574 RepID=UPI003CD05390